MGIRINIEPQNQCHSTPILDRSETPADQHQSCGTGILVVQSWWQCHAVPKTMDIFKLAKFERKKFSTI